MPHKAMACQCYIVCFFLCESRQLLLITIVGLCTEVLLVFLVRDSMEPKEKIDLLQKALNQLIQEEKGNLHDYDSGENTPVLLSKLLSQLDSLKEAEPPLNRETSASANEVTDGAISNEEIMKELREVKKQNSRTHRLLSAMIALTLAWQLSEVSIILILKQGLTNPFKSIGKLLKAIFKSRHSLNEQELERDAANKKQLPQICSFPGLKAPEIPDAVLKQ